MRIDTYSFGNIIIDGKAYSSDLILHPDHIQEDWWRKQGHCLQVVDLVGVNQGTCEVVVIGTGANGMMKVAREVNQWLQGLGIAHEEHPTGKACDRYNALVQDGKQVVAALHLTC